MHRYGAMWNNFITFEIRSYYEFINFVFNIIEIPIQKLYSNFFNDSLKIGISWQNIFSY